MKLQFATKKTRLDIRAILCANDFKIICAENHGKGMKIQMKSTGDFYTMKVDKSFYQLRIFKEEIKI